jgi:ABC-type multidrug transport system fused ATPase/permease subunit
MGSLPPFEPLRRGQLIPAAATTAGYRSWLREARGWWPRVLLIAVLHYATLMALPVTLLELGTRLVVLPLIGGALLEVFRGLLRRSLKRRVRSTFIREAARQGLDRRTLVPEADVESAFWTAHLLELAITVNFPALLAAGLAGVSILALAAPAVSGTILTALLTLGSSMIAFAVWSNRQNRQAISEVVVRRQRAAGWVAAAERDGGEIYGERARLPFLARVTDSVRAWSVADERLEAKRLQYRLLLGVFFLTSVLAILRLQRIDLLHLAAQFELSTRSVSGFLLLGTALPVGYVFWLHADALLAAYSSLIRILPRSDYGSARLHPLRSRPRRLRASALCFSYPGSSARMALKAVSFDVELSRITLIIAPNGAGKTTLARLICGVLKPGSGAIELDERPCAEVSHDDYGFVPQSPLIVEALSIEENVRLVAPDAEADAIERTLGELGLVRPLQQLAGELSRGQQRRIAIARAILKRPRLLLLDEPDVWLDTEGRALLAQLLEAQLTERAVIVISHRREWLPGDANVIDLDTQMLFGESDISPSATGAHEGNRRH